MSLSVRNAAFTRESCTACAVWWLLLSRDTYTKLDIDVWLVYFAWRWDIASLNVSTCGLLCTRALCLPLHVHQICQLKFLSNAPDVSGHGPLQQDVHVWATYNMAPTCSSLPSLTCSWNKKRRRTYCMLVIRQSGVALPPVPLSGVIACKTYNLHCASCMIMSSWLLTEDSYF